MKQMIATMSVVERTCFLPLDGGGGDDGLGAEAFDESTGGKMDIRFALTLSSG